MPTISAAHDLYNGDTAPDAPGAGFCSIFFVNGRPQMRRPGQAPLDLMPRWTVQMISAGDAEAGAFFGRHTVPEAVFVTRLELEAQEAPVGASLTVELVDAAGASFAAPRTITIADGEFYATADIADIAVASGVGLRAKVTAVGSLQAGGWLTLRLFITPQ